MILIQVTIHTQVWGKVMIAIKYRRFFVKLSTKNYPKLQLVEPN